MQLCALRSDGTASPEAPDYSRPTLLFLGGKGMIKGTEAAGHLNFLHRMLGRRNLFEPDVGIVAAVYPYSFEDVGQVTRHLNSDASLRGYYDATAYDFVVREFFPLITQGAPSNVNRTIRAARRPIDQVKRAFTNIRIMTHSFGGIVCDQVGNALVHAMHMTGYDRTEIMEATREILVVKIGTTSNEDKGLANFTLVNFLHDQDGVVPRRSTYIDTLRKRRELANNPASSVHVFHNSQNDLVVFFDRLGSDGGTHYTNANSSGHWVDKEGSLCRLSQDADAHGFSTYLSPKPNSLLCPLMIRTVIVRGLDHAVANGEQPERHLPLPPPRDLLRMGNKSLFRQADGDLGIYGDLEAIAQMIGYNKRVENAFSHYAVQPEPITLGRPALPARILSASPA